MAKMDRDEFLNIVRDYAKTDPSVMFDLAQMKYSTEEAVYQGLLHRMSSLAERAADMETVASAALGRRSEATNQLIRQKLEKWRAKCSLRWDWYLDEKGV